MKKLALALILCSPLLAYAKAVPPKAVLCASCHGPKGISDNPQTPNLAGQHSIYLIKQLKEIKAGTLSAAPAIKAIISQLDEKEMHDLAHFYAKMPGAKGVPLQKAEPRGEQLYKRGDYTKHITACITCHGPRGTGNGQAGFPIVRGQHAAYTLEQLQAFKSKQRGNDLNHIMQNICSGMNQDDMEALAHYIEALH